MLRRLSIRDLAIIDHLELVLQPGFTVITGETGAGKSILVDALELIAGGRAEAHLVRPGAERTEVSAEFDLSQQPNAEGWLKEQELDDEQQCLLRRTVRAEGGSRCWINGRAATVQQLKSLCAMLLEIHGQHEHQALLERSHQRHLLDQFGGLQPQLAPVASAARAIAELNAEISQSLSDPAALADQHAQIRQQREDLEALQPEPERLAALDEEQRRLSHAENLLAGLAQVEQWLDGDDAQSGRSLLLRAEQELGRLSAFDAQLQPLEATLEEARLQIEEVAREVRDRAESGELDPARLAKVEAALSSLHVQARRHRVLLSELPAVLQDLQQREATLAQRISRAEQFDLELARLREAYLKVARVLGKVRREAAGRLASAVQDLMGELGMAGGRFEVQLSPRPPEQAHPQGAEQIEFLVCANPGMSPQPLRKVASGGELARIGLAIKVATVDVDDVPVLVFDEVDSGIGGGTAEIVGRKLRRLGDRRQVFAVTHLPQVAASAHQHLLASKSSDQGATVSALEVLDQQARNREIARMLAGTEITDRSLAHAEELLERAEKAE